MTEKWGDRKIPYGEGYGGEARLATHKRVFFLFLAPTFFCHPIFLSAHATCLSINQRLDASTTF